MGYYKDVRQLLAALEEAGKLVRVGRAIDKDTELHPLVRLQFRGLPEEQRRAFLFEDVRDGAGNRYTMPVALGCYAGSTDIYAVGMQCRPDEIYTRWVAAQTHPIAPRIVESGPVQERVLRGEEIRNAGLGILPVPISTPGFDNGPYTTASHWVTKDPETGVINVGNYRGQVKSPDRLGCMCNNEVAGLRVHWHKHKARGGAMEVAVVIGAPPNVAYTAVARLPHEVGEYDVAGGIAGEPLEVVRCLTVDLLVPAHAEIVIEGRIPTDRLEAEGPFGEFTGYMAHSGYAYFMDITCITMRSDPIYVGFLSQFPPSESSKLRGTAWEGGIRKRLADAGMGNVLDVALHESTGSWGLLVVRLQKPQRDDFQRVIGALRMGVDVGKMLVVVDEDIDARDPDSVNWALAFRMQPHRDIQVVEASVMPLDPSIVAPGDIDALRNPLSERQPATVLCIDATRPWDYQPTSLPGREFMERAQGIWSELGLPPLRIREPWYGYDLGYWTDRNRQEAQEALQGRHYEIGRTAAAQHRRDT